MQNRTPEQTQAILRWRNQNQEEIRSNYQRQYIACGTSEILAAGSSYDFVESAAQATNQPFIIDWIPTTNGGASFYGLK